MIGMPLRIGVAQERDLVPIHGNGSLTLMLPPREQTPA